MPYDRNLTHELLKIASAHASTPMGEFSGKLGQQLLDAETEMMTLTKTIADLRASVQEAERRLVTEAQAHIATKTNLESSLAAISAQKAELITGITAIAADSRGAKRIATDLIEKFNPTAPAAPTP